MSIVIQLRGSLAEHFLGSFHLLRLLRNDIYNNDAIQFNSLKVNDTRPESRKALLTLLQTI